MTFTKPGEEAGMNPEDIIHNSAASEDDGLPEAIRYHLSLIKLQQQQEEERLRILQAQATSSRKSTRLVDISDDEEEIADSRSESKHLTTDSNVEKSNIITGSTSPTESQKREIELQNHEAAANEFWGPLVGEEEMERSLRNRKLNQPAIEDFRSMRKRIKASTSPSKMAIEQHFGQNSPEKRDPPTFVPPVQQQKGKSNNGRESGGYGLVPAYVNDARYSYFPPTNISPSRTTRTSMRMAGSARQYEASFRPTPNPRSGEHKTIRLVDWDDIDEERFELKMLEEEKEKKAAAEAAAEGDLLLD